MVVGILTAILFTPFFGLGITGAIRACEAADEAKRGNTAEYKKRICRSKAYALTGIGLGLLLIALITVASVGSDYSYRRF